MGDLFKILYFSRKMFLDNLHYCTIEERCDLYNTGLDFFPQIRKKNYCNYCVLFHAKQYILKILK